VRRVKKAGCRTGRRQRRGSERIDIEGGGGCMRQNRRRHGEGERRWTCEEVA